MVGRVPARGSDRTAEIGQVRGSTGPPVWAPVHGSSPQLVQPRRLQRLRPVFEIPHPDLIGSPVWHPPPSSRREALNRRCPCRRAGRRTSARAAVYAT
jgi:hypothetical protein